MDRGFESHSRYQKKSLSRLFFFISGSRPTVWPASGTRTPEPYADTDRHGEAVASPRGATATREARPSPTPGTKKRSRFSGSFFCSSNSYTRDQSAFCLFLVYSLIQHLLLPAQKDSILSSRGHSLYRLALRLRGLSDRL